MIGVEVNTFMFELLFPWKSLTASATWDGLQPPRSFKYAKHAAARINNNQHCKLQ